MMETLLHLPFQLEWEALANRLRLDEDDQEDFRPLFDEAMRVAHPRAAFSCVAVAAGEGDSVLLDGARFDSPLLARNLKGRMWAYPFVITSGTELYELSQSQQDPILRYWLEATAEAVLRAVTGDVFAAIRARYQTEAKYTMNPGSLPAWPITQQKPLFALLGDVEGRIGVRLTPSMLMLPPKSVSGLLFESEESYSNCALCTRLDCPSRRAPYHS